MAAFNSDGKVVAVGDQVTILGGASVVTGTGPLATVTVLPLLSTSTISVVANDCGSVDNPSDATHPAQNRNGGFFGAGDRVSVPGTVTAVSGSGNTATLTVTLGTSGGSVTVPAGSVKSAQFNG